MSYRNTLTAKRARKQARVAQRTANTDAALYSGQVRFMRGHTSRAGVEYPPRLIKCGSGGRTTKVSQSRLIGMSGNAFGAFPLKVKPVPLTLELKERIAWSWKMRQQAARAGAAAPPKPAWPPWRDAERAARRAKRAA